MTVCVHNVPLSNHCQDCEDEKEKREEAKKEKKLNMTKVTREHELAAALLWLRNHYDIEENASPLRMDVLKRVDQVLADGPPLSIEHQVAFRSKYPRDEP